MTVHDRPRPASLDLPLDVRTAPPPPPPDLIERRSLLRTARLAMSSSIVQVIAPPGFGKTSLLAALHERAAEARSHWLGARSRYGGRADLAGELAAALGVARDGITDDDVEDHLVDALRRREGRSVIMLDDADSIVAARIEDVLVRLVQSLPGKLQFVLATRRRPRSHALTSLMLRGGLEQITWEQLVMSRDEARLMLPAGIDAQHCEPVIAACRGWPAALHLAARAMAERSGGVARAVREFVGGSSAEVQDLIAWAAAVSGDARLGRIMELAGYVEAIPAELISPAVPGEDQHPFDDLMPLVEASSKQPGWFNPHPLLAAVCAQTFARIPIEERARRHAGVADWFSRNNSLEEAVHHAVETGDFHLAEGSIREAGGVRIFLKSGFPTLYRLISHLPQRVILESANLQLCKAVVFAKSGNLESARELVEDVKRSVAEGNLIDALIEDVAQIDSLISIYEDRIDGDEQIAALERETRNLSPREMWRVAWAANHLCIGYTVQGRLDDAESEAQKALTCYRDENMRYAQVFILVHLALIANSRGNPNAAQDWGGEAEALLERGQRVDQHLQAIVAVPLAEAAYARGEFERAAHLIEPAIPLLEAGEAWVDLLARAYHTRMRIAVLRDETQLALSLLDRADQVAHRRNLKRLKTLVLLMRLEVMSRGGLVEAADEIAGMIPWLSIRDLSEPGLIPRSEARVTWREQFMALHMLARVHWARGEHQLAISSLDALENAAKRVGNTAEIARARGLRCCYLWSIREYQEARQNLQLAVAVAAPRELVCMFLEDKYLMGMTIRGILRRFGASSFSHATVEFTNHVLGTATDKSGHAQSMSPGKRFDVLLTDHEQEVLEHLARGLSNKQIALRIDKTEATVKYHLRRIYAKLGVRSRAMALVTARKTMLLNQPPRN
jgi:LuxR family maltose regulon positive regulatory protein